ncbi:histidine kinase [Catenulispora acidiphila DSM 44928]|uniref:histidine kinase n=1 Tax=Catenulispora acidiphila (strain DSM 44928 / JCM 14897 / NBRC 102108 / NRRL B-24433 / ID139908) TaxID=479433 RepID=C7QBF9_CATAD|nr:sensor histidine kinase [Catenulispora acidiphila]ACU70536.1 histidine kinase [Catenulispora acidiphila DSM 44928]
MSEARPLMTRVTPARVVACVWVLSTLSLFIAQALRLKRPWGGTVVGRDPSSDPLMTDHRQLVVLIAAAGLVALGCRLLGRRPVSAVAAVAALMASVFAVNYDLHTSAIAPDQYVAVCVAVFFVAAGGGRRVGIWCAALAFAGVVGYVAASLVLGLRVDTSIEVVVLLITVLAWVLGDARRAEREHAEQLRAQVAGRAVTAERLRIARDLHDMVAHEIGVVALQAGAARLVVLRRPDAAEQALGIIEDTSRTTLAGLRRMVATLHDAPADPVGLEGIGRLVANARAAGVRVDVQWRGRRLPLPPEVDSSVFRVIQESVTNVIKHSGTKQCRVSVGFEDGAVSVVVVDSGAGSDAGGVGSTGYGLPGMRARIEILHGEFSAGPRPEGGFRVAARVPVSAPVSASVSVEV